ncbi:MAG: hypothetical protein H8E10_19200 [Desulfobacterales bacterium]|nr:hypothetical protein [Desulfobacterales bacterium]MBL7173516.1 hypothetical protein [Desulfobacteraceae bacterium]
MRRRKVIVYAVALLVIGFVVFHGENLSFAGETNPPRSGQTTCYDEAGKVIDCSDNPTDTDTNSEVAICSGCSTSVVKVFDVVITNKIFISGTNCECVAYESITIGPGVTVENGANVTFSAPRVYLQSGFQAKQGSVVKIEKWEEPPIPPG